MATGRIPSTEGGIQPTTVDAKGDLIVGTAADTVARLAAGTNEHRLVADSSTATGLKYVADTTNYAIAAKGDLLAGTAADTVGVLTLGTNNHVLTADSSTATGLKWAAVSSWSPNLTLLNAGGTAMTGSATITVNVSSYDYYLVFFTGGSSASSGSTFRLRINGEQNTYNWVFLGNGAGSLTGGNNMGGGNSGFELGTMGNSAGNDMAAVVTIVGGKGTGYKSIASQSFADGSTTNTYGVRNGYSTTSSAVTSISLVSSTGNFDAGTLYVYGG